MLTMEKGPLVAETSECSSAPSARPPFCAGWKRTADISVPHLLDVCMTDCWEVCFCVRVVCGQKINRVLLGLSEHSVVRVLGSSGAGLAVRDGAQCPGRGGSAAEHHAAGSGLWAKQRGSAALGLAAALVGAGS